MSKHTPGPWRVGTSSSLRSEWSCHSDGNKHSGWQPVVDGSGAPVAFVVDESDEWELRKSFDADARLIAAAPALLEALEALLTEAEDLVFATGGGSSDVMRDARAAIKAARGKA